MKLVKEQLSNINYTASDIYLTIMDYFPDVSEAIFLDGLTDPEIDAFPDICIDYIEQAFDDSEAEYIMEADDEDYLADIAKEIYDIAINIILELREQG